MREFVTLSSWQVKTPLDALLLSLLCVALVFSVLIIISFVMMLMNKIRALDVKEPVIMKDGTEVDDDMMAAILVATIDYRKEKKEDVKVISCKLIEQDDPKKVRKEVENENL